MLRDFATLTEAMEKKQLCPKFHRAIELVGRRWTGAVVSVLMSGSRRFNELLGAVDGVSDRLLTERLRELEVHGLVRRDVRPGPPITVRYELTPAGKELGPALEALASWADRHFE